MTKKEKKFCQIYSALNNLKEAAVHAGYPAESAQSIGEELIGREDVLREIQRISAQNSDSLCDRAIAGLLRIAFGNADDCIRLLFCDEMPDLSSMNLFNISEIKRPKGGGLEIKFADRTKALSLLYEIGKQSEDADAVSFFECLEEEVIGNSEEVRGKDDFYADA